MKKIYSILAFAIILLIIFLFTQNEDVKTNSTTTNEQQIILNNDTNLREGPGLSYPAITFAKKGQAVSLVEQRGEWILVSVSKDVEGWVPLWHTSVNEEQSTLTQKVAVSTIDGLNVRSEPTTSSAVLEQIPFGSEVAVVKEEAQWVKISNAQGTDGWVSKNYVQLDEKTIDDGLSPTVDTKVEEETFFTILVESANARKEPNSSAELVDVVAKDNTFKLLEQKNNWVKLQLSEDKEAWVSRFYGFADTLVSTNSDVKMVTIIYGGTNLRESPNTLSPVLKRANIGETFEILETEGDWYKVAISSEETAYVAKWVVSADLKEQNNSEDMPKVPRKKGTLNGLTIVLDPGHGGNDQGTAGYRGSIEKEITLSTAQLLQAKLQGAGATVYLTRESDLYVDLRKRVSIAHSYAADAFISIHYDATEDSTISGFTTYYYHDYQQKLAQSVNDGLSKKVTLRDRGAQLGDYLVLRENYQNAILIELGYLSNPAEERVITSELYREQATLGIYEGIINYFDYQLP